MIETQLNEWVKVDPRRINPPGYGDLYPITSDLILTRMNIMIPPELINDKKILDLGCGIPYNELWCNLHNAKLYHGVEVQKELAEKGNDLVSHNNKVFYDSIESFVEQADLTQYDIIIAQSCLNSYNDLKKVLNAIFKSKASLIIESTKLPSEIQDTTSISIGLGPQHTHEVNEVYQNVQRWKPTLSALKFLCKLGNYQVTEEPNELLKKHNSTWKKQHWCIWAKPLEQANITHPYMKDYEWHFNKHVAKIFEEHAPQHIPDYNYIINSLPNIFTENNISKSDSILEVGCATGKTLRKLYYNGYTNLYATEISQDMLDVCPTNLATYYLTDTIPDRKFKVILANWTLHFNENKKDIIIDIFEKLDDDGIFICSDKTTHTNKELYYKWKMDNGVSLNEIKKKETMLVDKMFLHSKQWYEKVFMTMGSYELYNKKLGFCSWLVKKSKIQ